MVCRSAPSLQGGAWTQRTAKAALGPCGIPCTHPQGEGEFLGVGRTKAERVALFIFSRVLEVSAMSGSQKFRLRLSPQLAAQVQTMAELWNVPFAAVLRLAVEE